MVIPFGNSRLTRTVAALAAVATLAGCSSAVGTDLAAREDILKTLRAQGFLFNKHVISTVQGASPNQVVVSGQMAQKTPDNRHVANGYKITQFRSVTVQNDGGSWQISARTPVEREQLSTRQRW